MRAFVFSLDAFVAFILALVTVYTLIFFSSVPSAYYFILTQAHYLSRDALLAAAQTDCTAIISGACSGSVLDNILEPSAITTSNIKNSIGAAIPNQFGYRLEKKSVDDGDWEVIYDTSTAGGDPHARAMKKLQVSTSIVNIGLLSERALEQTKTNHYVYNTCGAGTATGGSSRLITCGDNDLLPPQEESIIVPTKATIVRLTVFI